MYRERSGCIARFIRVATGNFFPQDLPSNFLFFIIENKIFFSFARVEDSLVPSHATQKKWPKRNTKQYFDSVTLSGIVIVLRCNFCMIVIHIIFCWIGAQAMAGGSFRNPLFIVAWPTAEFGGMGLEGFFFF